MLFETYGRNKMHASYYHIKQRERKESSVI